MDCFRVRLVRATVLSCVAALLAACGGGGTSSTPHAAALPSLPPANATGTLTIKYPTGFHVASTGLSKSRSPAYVNPTIGNFIDVDDLVYGVNEPVATVDIAPTADGTQTVTVPLFSTLQNELTATEWDSSGQDLLAQGSAGPISLPAGSTNAITMTLNMNETRIVLTTDPVAGSDALVLSQSGLATPFCLPGATNVFVFGADPSAGYVLPGTPAGYGGIALPALTSQSSSGTSQLLPQQLSLRASFDGANDPISATFGVTSPATGNSYSAQAALYDPAGANCTNPGVVLLDPYVILLNPYEFPTPSIGGVNLTNGNSVNPFPVIAWQGYTYWPFSFVDNRFSLGIAKYDSEYNLIGAEEFPGDRYASSATINLVAQTVSFQCQSSVQTIAWSALADI